MNFTWEETKKPLVVFIPNYGRGDYIRRDINNLILPDNDRFLIIIGNDGIEENFDDLYTKNVRYFTLSRKDNYERNGCFIRNYFIKRCQSDWILQKDPETMIRENFSLDIPNRYLFSILDDIEHFSGKNCLIRPLYTYDVSKSGRLTPQKIDENIPHRMHWAFWCPTKMLQSIHGYDEDYTVYGFEDTDLFFRLKRLGPVILEPNLMVWHIWHPINDRVFGDVDQMRKVFESKADAPVGRNTEGWGEG